MTEVTAAKSSPEPNNDQSVSSTTITENQVGTGSQQATKEMPIATTSRNDKCETPSKVGNDPQTSTERGPFYQHSFSDSDDDGSNDTNELYRFSDNDFIEKEGSSSSDNYESTHEGHLDDVDLFYTKISHSKADKKDIDILKNMTQNIMKTLKKNKITNTSSSDEDDCLLSQIASKDGGESSKTKDAPSCSWKEEVSVTSSDEEASCIIDQVKAVVRDGGECSTSSNIYQTEEDPLKERSDQNSSDDDFKCTPSFAQTYIDDGENSKTKDELAGPNKGKNHSSTNDGANTPCSAKLNEEESKTEVAIAGPSNEEQVKFKPPIKNKAERKLNYTVPFKKSKKF